MNHRVAAGFGPGIHHFDHVGVATVSAAFLRAEVMCPGNHWMIMERGQLRWENPKIPWTPGTWRKKMSRILVDDGLLVWRST